MVIGSAPVVAVRIGKSDKRLGPLPMTSLSLELLDIRWLPLPIVTTPDPNIVGHPSQGVPIAIFYSTPYPYDE